MKVWQCTIYKGVQPGSRPHAIPSHQQLRMRPQTKLRYQGTLVPTMRLLGRNKILTPNICHHMTISPPPIFCRSNVFTWKEVGCVGGLEVNLYSIKVPYGTVSLLNNLTLSNPPTILPTYSPPTVRFHYGKVPLFHNLPTIEPPICPLIYSPSTKQSPYSIISLFCSLYCIVPLCKSPYCIAPRQQSFLSYNQKFRNSVIIMLCFVMALIKHSRGRRQERGEEQRNQKWIRAFDQAGEQI